MEAFLRQYTNFIDNLVDLFHLTIICHTPHPTNDGIFSTRVKESNICIALILGGELEGGGGKD